MLRKLGYLLIAISMLIPLSPVSAVHQPEPPAPRVQAQETQEAQAYLLQLTMPEVALPFTVDAAHVPGYYHAALARQWTEVEGVLSALQERGWVETYTLLPEANAFSITAQPVAEAHLEQLGALSRQAVAIQAAGSRGEQFQARLSAEIQTAQMQMPQQRPADAQQRPADARQPEPEAPTVELEPEGDAFLVQLQRPDDRQTAGEQQRRVDAYLDWLVREGDVLEYRWLPQANAFRVMADGWPERLHGRPEIAAVVEYSEEAVDEARAAERVAAERPAALLAIQAPLGIAAYTPTTPTVELELYNYWFYVRSYTNTTTTFLLYDSADTLKNDPDYTEIWWWEELDGNYRAEVYLYTYYDDPWGGWLESVRIEPDDRLEVAQEGETAFSMDIPTLTAYADPDTNTVTGQAPPGITSTDPITPPALYVNVQQSQYVTTDAGGAYTADNVGNFSGGDQGQLRYYDAHGNQVYRYFSVPVVNVRGYSGEYSQDNLVSGYVADPYAPVTVILERSAVEVTRYDTTSSSDGGFNAYLDEDIQGDDVVKVESGGRIIEVNVPNFDDLVSDPDTNTVTGNTDAVVVTDTYGLPQTLAVWPTSTYDGSYGKHVVLDGAGYFTATNPFYSRANPDWGSANLDWDMGAVGHLRYVDASGNRVYTRFNAPYPPPVIYARGYRNYDQYYAENTVGGYVAGCQYEFVDLRLEDSTGAVKAQASRECDWSGSFYWWAEVCDMWDCYAVNLQAGDRVIATFGGETSTVVVPAFEADANVDTDTVTGNTDAVVVTDTYGLPQTLAVWPRSIYDSQYGKYVLPDGSGDFTAANPFYWGANPTWGQTDLDINYGDVGHARYIDEHENRVYFRFQPPPGAPVLYVRGWGTNNSYSAQYRVGGYVPGYCDSIHGYGTVTLLDSSGAVKEQATNISACPNIYVNFNVNIAAGDTVEATFGEHTTTVVVPAFDAVSDPNTDAITGNTDADVVTTTLWLTQTLAVWPQSRYDWEYGKHILPEVNGDFTAANPFYYYADHTSISTTLNIRPGDLGHLRYIDADGNRVYDAFRAPMFYVRGDSGSYQGDRYVRAAIAPNTAIVVTLRRGGSVLATVSGVSDNNGNYSVWLTDIYGNDVYIQAGDEVIFEFGNQTVTVNVPTLEATADAQANEVRGVGPADIITTTAGLPHTLLVHIGGIYEYTETGVDGSFVVTGTINPGNSGWLRYTNADGYYVYDNFRAPVVYVRGQSDRYQADNYVSGYAPQGDTLVTLNLKRGTATVATAYRRVDSNGWFEVWFRDAYGNAVNIQGDDKIEIIAGGTTLTVDVPDFDVTSDAATDTVSGVTNADVVTDTITSYGMTQTLSIWPNRLDDYAGDSWTPLKNALPDASGHFTATNPFYYYSYGMFGYEWYTTTKDIQPGDVGHLRYIDASGNRIYAMFVAEREIEKPVVYVRGDYWNNRYHSDNYVSGYAADCSDAPVSIVIQNSAGAVKGQTTTNCDWNGRFSASTYTDRYGNPVNIEAGDTVVVSYGGQTTEVVVPNFNFTSDPNEDIVFGLTNATIITDTYGMTQTLAVWPTSGDNSYYDWSYGKYVTLDMETMVGFYVARNPFYYGANPANGDQILDWGPGQSGHLRYVDANGNRVYGRFQAETPPQEYAKPQVYVRGYKYSYDPYGYYVAEDYIRIYNPICGSVDLTLEDSHGVVKAQLTNWRICNWSSTYLGISINPGDKVKVTSSDQTTVVEVPAFEVFSDPVNNRVTGTTNAAVLTDTYGLTQTLAVWPNSNYDWDYGKYLLLANNAFTATNPFYSYANPYNYPYTLNWNPGQQGHLRYVDAANNWVYARFVAPREKAEIRVHKDGNYVSGYVVATAPTPVTVTLKVSDTVKATAYATSDLAGWFSVNFMDRIGLPVLIEEGDAVVIETPGMAAVTVPVVPLTGQADVTAETVAGVGPANALLNVIVNPTWWDPPRQSAPTGADGAYLADFKGIRDIQPGDQVEVQHRNADGHTVYIRFYAGPKLFAQLHSFYAWGYSVAANAPVAIVLKDGAGNVKGSAATTSGWSNYFNAYLYDATGQRAIIAGGDILEADFGGGHVVSMTVASLAATVDADADTIAGTGPANDKLGVNVYDRNYTDRFNTTVDTAANGAWSADAGGQYDIKPGDQVRVRHINPNFHETWLYATAPVVYVRASGSGATAYWADNYVSGYASRWATVNVTLKNGSGATVATRQVIADSSSGYYATSLFDALGLATAIQDGYQVVISASPELTVTVPTINAEVDADTNTVHGATSLPNTDLGVWVNGYNQTARTDASGLFTVTVGDIYPGNSAYVRYQNEAGHWIHARFQAQSTGDTVIYARWSGSMCSNCASGYASASNVVATVALKRGGATLAEATGLTNNDRWFNVAFTDDAGNAVPIETGDVIEVTASDPVSMTVEALTVEADAEVDRLYGTGPAGGQLRIEGNCSGNTTINADGEWWFACGLGNSSNGYLYYTHTGGHRTYLGWAVPYVYVREYGNYVGGYVRRGVPVNVTLQSSTGSERAMATTTSNAGNGQFWVDFLDAGGNPIIIQPNDVVVVQASPATTVPVVPLSAEVDTANDRVTGTGPANETLSVYTGNCSRNVTTGADGAFTADFSSECDLRPGDWVQVVHYNTEGNAVYIDFNAPMVRVNVVNNIVDGYATPNATANLTLTRDGAVIATATATTGMGGWFSAFFTDADGNLIDIQPGDTVEVTASPTVDVNVVALHASVNAATDTVTGSGPANSLLLLKVFSQGGGWSSSRAIHTDGDGDFTADFSGQMDLTNASYAYVRYSDATGNQSSFHTTPARSPRLNNAEQTVLNRGATVEYSAFDAANGGDLTPPIAYQGGGGGSTLVFASQGGSLVLTRPDGSVDDSGANVISVQNAADGLWQVQVRVTGEEGVQYAVAIGKILLPQAGVLFTPDHDVQAQPGDVLTFTHTLTNTGNTIDTFDLTLTGDWATLLTATPLTLTAGATATVQVEVAVPATALYDTVNTTLITTTSQLSPEVLAAVRNTVTVHSRESQIFLPLVLRQH